MIKKKLVMIIEIIRIEMKNIVKSFSQILPFGNNLKKYLPFFIGFKLLTFTGFLTYLMNR